MLRGTTGKLCRGPLNVITGAKSIRKYSVESKLFKSTLDEEELPIFKKLSSGWWNEGGELKPLHSMNRLRVPLVRDGLINNGKISQEYVDSSRPLRNQKILDVGCAGGILTEALGRIGADVTGIDVNTDLIEQAKNHVKFDKHLSNVTYICVPIESFSPNNSEKFDAIVASEVIEHVNEKHTFLEECVKCLKPGGSIFVTTLNKTAMSWFGGIIMAEYVLGLVPRGTHHWEKFAPPHQIQQILEESNCRTKLVHGMCYNFLTNQWNWISDTSISYALHAVKL